MGSPRSGNEPQGREGSGVVRSAVLAVPPAAATRWGCGSKLGAGDRRRLIQDAEDALGRLLALGTGMELGPGSSEREKDFGRYQQDPESDRQGEMTREKPKSEHHGHQTNAETRDQFHGKRREKRDAQCPHCAGAQSLRGGRHLAASLILAAECSQGWGGLG